MSVKEFLFYILFSETKCLIDLEPTNQAESPRKPSVISSPAVSFSTWMMGIETQDDIPE